MNWGHKTIAGPRGLQIKPLSIDLLAILSPIDKDESNGLILTEIRNIVYQ